MGFLNLADAPPVNRTSVPNPAGSGNLFDGTLTPRETAAVYGSTSRGRRSQAEPTPQTRIVVSKTNTGQNAQTNGVKLRYNSLVDTHNNLIDHYNNLKKQLSESPSPEKIKDLEKQITDTEKNLQTSATRITELTKKNEGLSTQILETEKRIIKLKEANTREVQILKKNLTTADARVKELETTIQETKAELEELRINQSTRNAADGDKITELVKKLDGANIELETTRLQTNELETQLRELNAQNEQLTAENARLNEELEDIRGILDKQVALVDQERILRDQLSQTYMAGKALYGEYINRGNELNKTQAELADSQQKYQQQEAELVAARAELQKTLASTTLAQDAIIKEDVKIVQAVKPGKTKINNSIGWGKSTLAMVGFITGVAVIVAIAESVTGKKGKEAVREYAEYKGLDGDEVVSYIEIEEDDGADWSFKNNWWIYLLLAIVIIMIIFIAMNF